MVSRLEKLCSVEKTSSVIRVQINEKMSTEEWNLAVAGDDFLTFKFKMRVHDMELRIYPKGDSSSGNDIVTAYMLMESPLERESDSESVSLFWAGRFQKQGNENSPVSLENDKTWKFKFGPVPVTVRFGYGGDFMTRAEIPDHIIDGFLVFRAEIQLSTGQTSSHRYFDKNIETQAFLKNLTKTFGDDDSDFTVKASGGKTFPCHKLILSAHSEYFKTLLDSGNETAPSFNENNANEVSLEDIDNETMSLTLRYMYSLDLPNDIPRGEVTELLVTADRLQMTQLVNRCINLLMYKLKKTDLIQTFIIIDKFKPECSAREDIFVTMKKNKKSVAKSKDFSLFVKKYPDLAVEFMQAVLQ